MGGVFRNKLESGENKKTLAVKHYCCYYCRASPVIAAATGIIAFCCYCYQGTTFVVCSAEATVTCAAGIASFSLLLLLLLICLVLKLLHS